MPKTPDLESIELYTAHVGHMQKTIRPGHQLSSNLIVIAEDHRLLWGKARHTPGLLMAAANPGGGRRFPTTPQAADLRA